MVCCAGSVVRRWFKVPEARRLDIARALWHGRRPSRPPGAAARGPCDHPGVTAAALSLRLGHCWQNAPVGVPAGALADRFGAGQTLRQMYFISR